MIGEHAKVLVITASERASTVKWLQTFCKVSFAGVALGLMMCAAPVFAQTLTEDAVSIVRASVVSATDPVEEELPGLGKKQLFQEITAEIEEGSREGERVTFTNDYAMLATGDTFYLKHLHDTYTSSDYYSVADPYRLPVLGGLFMLFFIICAAIGRWQGVRGMLSLIASIAAVYYILIPLILAGFSPVFSALLVASLIVVLGSYITHGVSRTTSSAVLGMVLTIIGTGLLAHVVIGASHLTGYASDESIFLSLNSGGALSLVSLLLGGVLIGLLGVLYDSAIGQAVAVEELYRAAQGGASGVHANTTSTATPLYVFTRAMRIGREHIGALVNTLAIAYVGASLPLLLLVSQASTAPVLVTLNSEVFATEIIRILIGSIGIIATVPITTAIAVYLLRDSTFLVESKNAHHHHTH